MIYLQTEYTREDSTQITSWNMTSQSPLHVAFQALTPHSPHETNPGLCHHDLVSLFGTSYKWDHKTLVFGFYQIFAQHYVGEVYIWYGQSLLENHRFIVSHFLNILGCIFHTIKGNMDNFQFGTIANSTATIFFACL